MRSRLPPACLFALGLLLAAGAASAQEDRYAGIRDRLEECAACHGENGASTNPEFPILAGQHLFYLYTQLKDFKAGRRADPIMEDIAREIEKDEMRLMARYFSEQAWPNIGFTSDPARAAAGKTAADSGQCVACHLGDYTGNSGTPRLSGQHPEYLNKTMLDFKEAARANAPAIAALMKSYSEEDIAAMADYLGGL